MANPFFEASLDNGLKLLVEPIPGVQSAAFTFLVPGGVAHDPADATGTANLLCNLVPRGAGDRDQRELTAALDYLGVQRHESTENFHTSFVAASLAGNLLPALELTGDIIRRPRLDATDLEHCKLMTLQEIQAIEDEPGQKLFIELKRRSLPDPTGRPVLGTSEHVRAATPEIIRAFHQTYYRPNGAILGVAGAVDFHQIRDQVERLFGDWEPVESPPLKFSAAETGRVHIPSDKLQTHIGIACHSVPYNDVDFYNAHGAVGVLSGGMSARLFTEVREKRGLCYSVGAAYYPQRDLGVIFCHAGTTSEHAEETLEVILSELARLKEGISENEVLRVRAGLKSSLIMQEESTAARASILARSWYNFGRVRTLEEVATEIEKLTPESILGYLEKHPLREFTVLTIGPEPVEVLA